MALFLPQVIFVDNLGSMDPSFDALGPAVEGHHSFPQKVNAEFVEVRYIIAGYYLFSCGLL